jgi:cbb3-type cytochrome oxidase subunit 3
MQLKLAMKLILRVAHSLLVLSLSAMLIYSVYYAFSLLRKQQRAYSPPSVELEGDADHMEPRKPSPQEIVSQ